MSWKVIVALSVSLLWTISSGLSSEGKSREGQKRYTERMETEAKDIVERASKGECVFLFMIGDELADSLEIAWFHKVVSETRIFLPRGSVKKRYKTESTWVGNRVVTLEFQSGGFIKYHLPSRR